MQCNVQPNPPCLQLCMCSFLGLVILLRVFGVLRLFFLFLIASLGFRILCGFPWILDVVFGFGSRLPVLRAIGGICIIVRFILALVFAVLIFLVVCRASVCCMYPKVCDHGGNHTLFSGLVIFGVIFRL